MLRRVRVDVVPWRVPIDILRGVLSGRGSCQHLTPMLVYGWFTSRGGHERCSTLTLRLLLTHLEAQLVLSLNQSLLLGCQLVEILPVLLAAHRLMTRCLLLLQQVLLVQHLHDVLGGLLHRVRLNIYGLALFFLSGGVAPVASAASGLLPRG